jgi:V/A-type H+-transporting ATPase subunit K
MVNIGDMSLSLALAAIGSAMGAGVAGMSAIGAWKRAFMNNKNAPFMLVAFVGAPLSQTIYGMIVRNAIMAAKFPEGTGGSQIVLGTFAGLAIGASAWMQGKVGASAADAMGETGKGFGNYMIVVGILETVALFVMVFVLTALPK